MAVYTTEEIVERIRPVVEKYCLGRVSLYGDYATGDATEKSEINLLVEVLDFEKINGWHYGGLYGDLEDALQKSCDVITERQLETRNHNKWSERFVEEVESERMVIINGNE